MVAYVHSVPKTSTFLFLNNSVGSCFSKIFGVKSRETIAECMQLFNCQSANKTYNHAFSCERGFFLRFTGALHRILAVA